LALVCAENDDDTGTGCGDRDDGDAECLAEIVKDPAQDSFVEKLIANVIKNLEVTVTNIHVRFEDNVTNPKKLFSVGVTLHELSLRVRLVYCVDLSRFICSLFASCTIIS